MAHDVAPPSTRRAWTLYAGVALAIAAYATGFIGLWQYEVVAEPTRSPDPWSIVYHTFQLFTLGSGMLPGDIPVLLTVGRYLAGILFVVGIAKALHAVFRDEWLSLRLRLPWSRGHVIICGLGQLGLRLAVAGSRRGVRVVVIDTACEPGVRALLRKSGVLVIDGDPADRVQLGRARARRANFILAVTGSDESNIAIAARAGQFAARRKAGAPPLVCRVMIANASARDVLAQHADWLITNPDFQVNLSDLDRRSIAVRQLLNRRPLDFERIAPDSDSSVHLVIVGFGLMGETLAHHAALIGHYSNEAVGKHRTRVTVVDGAARASLARFEARYPNVGLVCDIDARDIDLSSGELLPALAAMSSSDGSMHELVTYVFSSDEPASDLANFRDAAQLARMVSGRRAQTVFHQTSRDGFAALTRDAGSTAAMPSLVAFGMIEDVFTWDIVLHEEQDALASALHQAYLDGERRSGATPEFPPWAALGEAFRESNRRAADHIAVKLRALGCREAPLRDGDAGITRFSAAEQDQLARMEHVRWCAERWIDGWVYGPETNRDRKVNACLVPWSELPVPERGKDASQIAAIVPALHRVGRGIYR